MTPVQKDYIDLASYSDLLARWEFADTNNVFFRTTEDIDYYYTVMSERWAELSHHEREKIHKNFGLTGATICRTRYMS